MNLTPITINDTPHPDKISLYTTDPLPDSIYVASENYVFNLKNPYDYQKVTVLAYDNPNTQHNTKK